jgi:hypothetical protein
LQVTALSSSIVTSGSKQNTAKLTKTNEARNKELQSSRLKPLFQAENETFGTKLSLELIAERSRKNGIRKQKIYTTDK